MKLGGSAKCPLQGTHKNKVVVGVGGEGEVELQRVKEIANRT